MTREEQINQAAEAIDIKIISNPWTLFKKGAEWADAHPHWISVKDRKPKLKHSDDITKYSDTVIVTNGKYRTSARWVHNTWAGWYGWYDDGDEELKGITQWMPMPEPPTISKMETVAKNAIIGTPEHIQVALEVMNKKGGEK